MIKASQYRNTYTVIFRDAAGHVVLSMTAFAKTAKTAVKNAVQYGNPPAYYTVSAE